MRDKQNGFKSRAEDAEKQAQREANRTAELEGENNALKERLAAVDRQVPPEILRQNRQVLSQIKFAPDPNSVENIGRADALAGLKYGEIVLDEGGRIIETHNFAPAKYHPQTGAPRPVSFSPKKNPNGLNVIVDGEGNVLVQEPLAKPTGKQQSALEDLSKEAPRKLNQDPYSINALLGSELGPLAQDFYFLFRQIKVAKNNFGIVLETVSGPGGRARKYLRVYHDNPNQRWAFDAKEYLTHEVNGTPEFSLTGNIELNFKREKGADGSDQYALEYRLTSGLPQETKTEIEKMINYFGRLRAQKVRPMTVPPASAGTASAGSPATGGTASAGGPAARRAGPGTNGNPPGTVGPLPPPPIPPAGLGEPRPPTGGSGPRERQDTIPDSENFPTPALGTPAVDPHAVFGAIQPGPGRPPAADRSGARAIEPDLDDTAKTNPFGRAVIWPGNSGPATTPPRARAAQGMGPPAGAPPPPSARKAAARMASPPPLPGGQRIPSPVPPPPQRSPISRPPDSDRPTLVTNGTGILPPVPKPPPLPGA